MKKLSKLVAVILLFALIVTFLPTFDVVAKSISKNVFQEKLADLISTYGEFERNQTGIMHKNDDEWLKASGVMSSTIFDFDADGNNEMLVCYAKPMNSDEDSCQFYMDMYEAKNDRVILADSIQLEPYQTNADWWDVSLNKANWNSLLMNTNLLCLNDKYYIMCEYYSIWGIFGDGSVQGYWTMEYADEKLNYVCSFTQTEGGSSGFEFTGYDFKDGVLFNSNLCYSEEWYGSSSWVSFSDSIKSFFNKYNISLNIPDDSYNMGIGFGTILSDDLERTKIFEFVCKCTDSNYASSTYNFQATLDANDLNLETFDDAIYRANWLLGQETLLDLAMNGEQTPAEIIYNEAEASGLSTSSEAWQLLQDTLGAILDDPSGLLDKPLEKEQLYEGIIFAMFDASVDITIFPGENQAKKAVKETNSLLSLLKNVFKTKYDVDIADAFDAISLKPEYQKALYDTSEEYFKNLGISKASKFLSKINEAVTYFNDFEDYLKYEMDCMALMELGESYRDIMQAMYDACSWGNPDLKLALLDCINIMDDTMEDLVTKIAAGTFISAGVSTVKVGIQTIWNDAKTQVAVSNPYVAIIWGSYKASTYFADKVFGASSIAEKTVKLGALNDIKPLAFVVYQDAKKAFESDRSRENAENYLAALDVAYRYLDQDCGTAKSFAETMSSALAARLMSLFGAYDGTDTVSKIWSIQNLYSDDFEILNIGWLYDLEVDYPDEYPNYEYLMTDWEKKYLVSCPVDVYVYDKNENLVASSVGNMPYVADDSKFTVSVLGDRKTIYSYENMDSYTFKYVSTGMGTMDVTIEENNRSNDYPRIVKHVGVPLAEGVSYKSLDDVASSSNSYELETVENSYILKPSFDSANNVSMKYKLSVSNGFLLDEGQFGIEGDFLTGEKISIYASVPEGYVFKEWVSDGKVVFKNASALSTTVIMPNYAVAITATYESAGNDNGNGSSPSPSPSIEPPNNNSPSPSPSIKPSGSGGSGEGSGAGTTPTSTPVVILTPSPSPTPVTIANAEPSLTLTPTPKPFASIKPGTGSDSIFNNSSKKEITPADVTLNKKTIIYSGKEKKPGVTVLSGSLELIKDKEYTVSYSYNINVGTAYVTVYGKGDYYGSVAKSFKIIPKGTPVKGKAEPKHKGFAIKWKKQPVSITGYQVQYSTDKKFKGKTTVIRNVKKKSVTKLTVSKLKAKKKYYVRVRTYKTVKGKKYYSRWSKSKVVKTKK